MNCEHQSWLKAFLCLWINQILILFVYKFVFRYLKISKELTTTCYQNIKEILQKEVKHIKKTVKDMEVFLKKTRKKVVNTTKKTSRRQKAKATSMYKKYYQKGENALL